MVAVAAGVVVAGAAAAPTGLRLSLVGPVPRPEAGKAVSIVVRATRAGRPAHANVVVRIARGRVRRSFQARAESRGRYRARVVFPSAGRWTLGARAGRTRVTFGSVRVRRPVVPLTFVWPTSVDVESSRSLLLVENGAGRVMRVDPVTGRTTRIFSIDRPYSVAHGASGAVYLSAAGQLLRIDGGAATVVADAGEDVGPIAVGPNGDVYYATATKVFRIPGGSGTPAAIADGLSGPHGLAVTTDGGVLVSDTGNARVLRIDLASGRSEVWARLGSPRGMDIAPDGTVYIATGPRVVHFMADGRQLGFAGRRFHDSYDVAAAPDGSVYVVDTSAAGRLYRVAPDGTSSVVSRR